MVKAGAFLSGVHHWRNVFLADAGFDQLVIRGEREHITGERKVYWVRCDAALVDLRPSSLSDLK